MNPIKLINRMRRPDITFFKSGKISITARVAKALNLHAGDSINILIDKGEYLLYATHDSMGRCHAKCWPSQRNSHHFCANSATLCKTLFQSLNLDTPRVAFFIGYPMEQEETVYLPLITRNPILI